MNWWTKPRFKQQCDEFSNEYRLVSFSDIALQISVLAVVIIPILLVILVDQITCNK